MGFKDGTRNIAGTDADRLDEHVWVGERRRSRLDDRRLATSWPAASG